MVKMTALACALVLLVASVASCNQASAKSETSTQIISTICGLPISHSSYDPATDRTVVTASQQYQLRSAWRGDFRKEEMVYPDMINIESATGEVRASNNIKLNRNKTSGADWATMTVTLQFTGDHLPTGELDETGWVNKYVELSLHIASPAEYDQMITMVYHPHNWDGTKVIYFNYLDTTSSIDNTDHHPSGH